MIEDDELLHRAIKPKPQFWNTKSGSVTSALFKDSKGVSVDRNAGRDDEVIKASLQQQFENLKGEARFTAGLCREKECRVKADPVEGNENHSVVLGSNKIELTKGQARHISRNCQVITY